MKKHSNVGVALRAGMSRSLPVTAMALGLVICAGGSPVYAAEAPAATLPVQGATVAGNAPAERAASGADMASMVATLQKQIMEQQAMLQVLQKQLTSPDAVLASPPVSAPPPATVAPVSPPAPAQTPAAPLPDTPAGSSASPPAPAALPVPQDKAMPETTPPAPVPSTPAAMPAPESAASDTAPPVADGAAQGAAADTAPVTGSLTTDAQRQAYASGVTVWREIENSIASQRGLGIQLDEHYVMAGLSDMSAHRPLMMSPDDIARAMNSLNGDYVQRANEAKAHQEAEGKAYRIAFSKEKGAYSDAGAWYNIADKGQGRRLRTTDMVELSVVGRLPDGSVFDGSGLQGQTKIVKVGALLPAVAIGLQRVSPGGHLTVVIPPGKGYGDVGMPPSIPGGATLIFEITVKGLAGDR